MSCLYMKQTFYRDGRLSRTSSVQLPAELGALEKMIPQEFATWISANEPFQEWNSAENDGLLSEGSAMLSTVLSGEIKSTTRRDDEISIAPVEIFSAVYGDRYTGVLGNVYLIRDTTPKRTVSGWVTSDQTGFHWMRVKPHPIDEVLPYWKRKMTVRSIFLNALPMPGWIGEFLNNATVDLPHKGIVAWKLMQNLNWISQWRCLEDYPLKMVKSNPKLVYLPLTGQAFPKTRLVDGMVEITLPLPGCGLDLGCSKMRAFELVRHDGNKISILLPLEDQL